MRQRRGTLPRWLFYFAIAASWLLGAEIVVLTVARRSLPGRLPTFAGWPPNAAQSRAIRRMRVQGSRSDLVPQRPQRRLVLVDLGEAADRFKEVVVGEVVVDLADLADEH